MSRRKGGPQLPFALQKQLGIDEERSRRKGGQNAVRSRKEQRKAERLQKRRGGGLTGGHFYGQALRKPDYEAEGRVDEADRATDFPAPSPKRQKVEKKPGPKPLKSILKKPPPPKAAEPEEDFAGQSEEDWNVGHGSTSDDDSIRFPRDLSPEIVIDANSKSYKQSLAEDDDEILALEMRLGLKGKKLEKRLYEDGLQDLLGDMDDAEEGRERKREGDEWLREKRRRAERQKDLDFTTVSESESKDDDDLEGDEGSDEDVEVSSSAEDDSSVEDTGESGGFADFVPEREQAAALHPANTRENPYLPPVTPPTTTKYMPPSLRKPQSAEDESLARLRRQIQAHLNKLSASNLISILGEIESLYRSNPRQDVTSTLTSLLLARFCDPSALNSPFVILHAAFVGAVYKTIGTDFGAEVLSRLVERFSQYHTSGIPTKEPVNLISLLSNLFIFAVTSSLLIYDHIRLLLNPLTEINTDLLLRIIRDCGPQLRSDDPSSLKTIVSLTQSAAKDLEKSNRQMSVRTKFMLETIFDLKNNKMKESKADGIVAKEHITRMRKALGSLSSRNPRATEPLRVSLMDLQNSDVKGKWWLVGASWKGKSADTSADQQDDPLKDSTKSARYDEPDYTSLARSLALNTPLHTTIFTAIASSPNAVTAHTRLLKLNLKSTQQQEIPRVLLRCCGAEKAYNEFYGQLAKRMCAVGENTKKVCKSFEFAAWGFLKRLGGGAQDGLGDEDDEPDDADEGGVQMHEVSNVAQLFASLIHAQALALTLGVLRVLDLATLREGTKTQLFVELLLVRVLVLCEGDAGQIGRVFGRTAQRRQVVPRLMVFMRRFVRKSELLGEGKETKMVNAGYAFAMEVLRGIHGGES